MPFGFGFGFGVKVLKSVIVHSRVELELVWRLRWGTASSAIESRYDGMCLRRHYFNISQVVDKSKTTCLFLIQNNNKSSKIP